MQKQGGNFLLQALLALALIIAFIPFFTQKLMVRGRDSQMYATSNQIETAQNAAKIYLRENINSLAYDTTVISGDNFADTLEPYGLPLGFVPKTIFGQNISLVINKGADHFTAYLEIYGGDIPQIQKAELTRRLGFYASEEDGIIYLLIPLEENFSEIIRRDEKNIEENGFLSDLNMGGFGLENIGTVFARSGEFESFQTNSLSLFGVEEGRKIRNELKNIIAIKTTFQNKSGEAALTITRGVLNADNVSGKTISRFGDTGNFTSDSASVYDFSMTAGRTSFTGPASWDIRGNVITDKINFSTERMEISSYVNATRGQDVFISPDELEYSAKSGIEAGIMRAANITLRDQTSDALFRGETGAVILDIRPAGTSVLPDVQIDNINNDTFAIIAKPADNEGNTVDCKSIIAGLNGSYNTASLSQNIICQYVFWQRLEKRIDIKKCIMDGKNDCK